MSGDSTAEGGGKVVRDWWEAHPKGWKHQKAQHRKAERDLPAAVSALKLGCEEEEAEAEAEAEDQRKQEQEEGEHWDEITEGP